MNEATTPTQDIRDHQATYSGFVRGSIALCIYCAMILAALCNFAFGNSAVLPIGFGGLIVGLLALIIDMRSGSKTWALSIGVFVVFALVCAYNVT